MSAYLCVALRDLTRVEVELSLAMGWSALRLSRLMKCKWTFLTEIEEVDRRNYIRSKATIQAFADSHRLNLHLHQIMHNERGLMGGACNTHGETKMHSILGVKSGKLQTRWRGRIILKEIFKTYVCAHGFFWKKTTLNAGIFKIRKLFREAERLLGSEGLYSLEIPLYQCLCYVPAKSGSG